MFSFFGLLFHAQDTPRYHLARGERRLAALSLQHYHRLERAEAEKQLDRFLEEDKVSCSTVHL